MLEFVEPDLDLPQGKEVESAVCAIPGLLEQFGIRSNRQFVIRAPDLIKKLRDLEHSLPACEWAIHNLLVQQRLQVDDQSCYKPTWDTVLFDRVKSHFRDEMARGGFVWQSTSKPIEWDRSLLRSTRLLWEAIASPKGKPKGQTNRGSGGAKDSDTFDRWKSFLLQHHNYAGDLNQTPVTPTAIEQAGICSKAQSSRHFKRWGSFKKYKRICDDPKWLGTELKLLAGEMPLAGIGTLIADLQDATARNPAESIDDD